MKNPPRNPEALGKLVAAWASDNADAVASLTIKLDGKGGYRLTCVTEAEGDFQDELQPEERG